MFQFASPVSRVLAASAPFLFLSAALSQAAPNPTRTPGASRRINATRQARIARNIQETYSHRWEISGGGGFLRFRTGQYLQKISEVNFFMAGNYQLNPKWGVVADVRGHFGNANIPNLFVKNGVFNPQISEYTFMGGVQRRFLAREKYSVSANVTGGVALSKFGGDAKGLPSEDLGMWPDSNAKPAFSVNLIGEYNVYTNLAVRVQPTYLGTTFGNTLQNNLGVMGGVTYRFGHTK